MELKEAAGISVAGVLLKSGAFACLADSELQSRSASSSCCYPPQTLFSRGDL